MRKIALMVALALICCIALSACGGSSSKQSSAPKVDEEYMQGIKNSMNQSRAERSGDTYCKNCDKFIQGKVRICPYCGKYVNGY